MGLFDWMFLKYLVQETEERRLTKLVTFYDRHQVHSFFYFSTTYKVVKEGHSSVIYRSKERTSGVENKPTMELTTGKPETIDETEEQKTPNSIFLKDR